MKFIEVLVKFVNGKSPFTDSKEMSIVKINLASIVSVIYETNTVLVNLGSNYFVYELEVGNFEDLWNALDEYC